MILIEISFSAGKVNSVIAAEVRMESGEEHQILQNSLSFCEMLIKNQIYGGLCGVA